MKFKDILYYIFSFGMGFIIGVSIILVVSLLFPVHSSEEIFKYSIASGTLIGTLMVLFFIED